MEEKKPDWSIIVSSELEKIGSRRMNALEHDEAYEKAKEWVEKSFHKKAEWTLQKIVY